jgi:hypothetical protein
MGFGNWFVFPILVHFRGNTDRRERRLSYGDAMGSGDA